MKLNYKWKYFSVFFFLLAVGMVFADEGWKTQQRIIDTKIQNLPQVPCGDNSNNDCNRTSPEGQCIGIPGTNYSYCVYTTYYPNNDRAIDLSYIMSEDGGLSYNAPTRITQLYGDEYDPFWSWDATREQLILIYSRWRSDRNGVSFRQACL